MCYSSSSHRSPWMQHFSPWLTLQQSPSLSWTQFSLASLTLEFRQSCNRPPSTHLSFKVSDSAWETLKLIIHFHVQVCSIWSFRRRPSLIGGLSRVKRSSSSCILSSSRSSCTAIASRSGRPLSSWYSTSCTFSWWSSRPSTRSLSSRPSLTN